MTQIRHLKRWRCAALAAVLVTGIGVAPTPAQAQTAEQTTLITGNVVTINKTVSDAGFVHPGVGLSAEDLRNAQTQVRAGQQPWTSYFGAMSATGFASTSYRASNSKSAAVPDQPLDPTFTQVGLRNRETNDSFGALTQALMWTLTGDEVYRRNAIQALRTWSRMDPTKYAYFADAHIHTGHPLYQFLMAAEIIRATEPLADDSPGTYNGYDVVWHADDDQRLLTNFANPVVNTFLYSNTRWMNQHNFGLFGRIATAIYSDDSAGYAKGVEWLTVNSSYDGYDNGAMAPQMPLIHAGDADNPYGYDFVQVREMGRDQAHGECNIDNFTGLARMLDVQGTKVDPTAGTVSTAGDAVSAYDFLGQRLLDGANAFFGFMMGAPIPWVDERGEGWNGTISQAYRGRMFNPVNELYYEYKKRGIDVEQRAPWVAELAARMDGPYFYSGTGVANFWAPGDKNPEYWVAFPESIAGTTPEPQPADSNLGFDRFSLQLDDRTEIVTEDGKTFARAHVDEQGTTSVVSRLMHDSNGLNGVRVRSDGPARLEVLDKEATSGRNDLESEPKVLATVDIPDTAGAWRYVTYPEVGTFTNFYRLTGKAGTTVDLDDVVLQAQSVLTPPLFGQEDSTFYLTTRHASQIDLSATDSGGGVTYRASGLPRGASIDPGTGVLTWTPSMYDEGRRSIQVVADDGATVAARTFTLSVSKNYQKTVDAALADGTDPKAVYTTVTREPFAAALAAARLAAETGSAAKFDPAFATLLDTIKALRLLNPTLADGTLNYLDGVVTPTGIDVGGLKNLADDDYGSGTADFRTASFVLDFGTQYRITPTSFGLQARFTFGNRLQGTNVYGSNDGISWDLLTERETVNTNEWENINVVAEHADDKYRYLKLQVDHPGVATDPAYPGLWSFSGFRIHGQRSEVPGTVTTVSVSSPDALAGRVTSGDTVKVAFTSPKPITGVNVAVGGQPAQAVSEDGLSWTATAALGDLTGGGGLDIAIDHTVAYGKKAATIHGSTDGTALYGSDERNLIDLADYQVVESDKAAQSALMLDGNAATFSDVAAVAGKYYLTWDIGPRSTFSLDRVDFLARQDNNGMTRLPDLVFQGSNDLQNWTTLTGPGFKTLAWQNLPSLDHGEYRYLRVANSTFVDIAELRIFGSLKLDLEPILARADAVDLIAYTRASQILFPREVNAVRAAAAEPGADETALALRLLDAWDLLKPAVTSAPPVLDKAWVTASTSAGDGTLDAAANGWLMFDGNAGTYTNTTTKACTNTILPTDGTAFTVESIKYLPRSNAVSRSTGMPIQGSNDGGATWTTFGNTGTPVAGWNTLGLSAPVRYQALRISGGNGFCNVAELQFIVKAIDKTALDLYLSETKSLTEADWTTDSWADLVAARDAARAVATDKSTTQEEVDETTEALAAAIASLVKA